MLLVADIGGTNARFALAWRDEAGVLRLRAQQSYLAADASFESSMGDYLKTVDARPSHAAICAAGPVIDERVELLNSGWVLDAAAIWDRFDFDEVALFNDFAAMARAAPELQAGDMRVLQAGKPHRGEPMVIGGPGTGFGLAVLSDAVGGRRLISGEGGHRVFAPQTQFEWEVARALRDSYDYVSAEVVAGGKHVQAVYRAVCRVLGAVYQETEPQLILARAKSGNEACAAVCQLRADTTLSVLGDVALMAGAARGGVFVGGGESIRLGEYMGSKQALARFHQRGPRTDYLAQTPLSLIVNSDAGLIGAGALGWDRFVAAAG